VLAYTVFKGAVVTLTVSLSKALAKTGVTANTVSLGPIETDGIEDLFRSTGTTSADDALRQFREG
jgi:NAD(P)-dependent dehydrogenase (short-subunit alcohol dehydrogenase family)